MAEVYGCGVAAFSQTASDKDERVNVENAAYRYLLMCSEHPFFRKTVYGIRAEEYQSGNWETVAVVPDVSSDKSFVVDLIQRCSRYGLSPIHLMDVIMDAITDPIG